MALPRDMPVISSRPWILAAAENPATKATPKPLAMACSTSPPMDTTVFWPATGRLSRSSSRMVGMWGRQSARWGRMKSIFASDIRQNSAAQPWPITVAPAAPRTPQCSPATNTRSSTTFTMEEMIIATSGVRLLPSARRMAENRL